MSEIKNVGYTWMAKCNQPRVLPFKGLNSLNVVHMVNIYQAYSTIPFVAKKSRSRAQDTQNALSSVNGRHTIFKRDTIL